MLDTGSCVSLISKNVFDDLKQKGKLKTYKYPLSAANGSRIKIIGATTLKLKIGRELLQYEFIVAKNLSRSIILGKDFIFNNKVNIYTDIQQVKIRNSYVPLANDNIISSITRLKRTLTLKPNKSYLVNMIARKTKLDKNSESAFVPTKQGFLSEQPEIFVAPSLVTVNKIMPVCISNMSNKTIRLKKGCVLGTLEGKEDFVCAVERAANEIPPVNAQLTKEQFLQKAQIPDKHKSEISKFLLKNRCAFAFSDKDLLQTDLMVADIDTGDARPINVRPYRTPLHQRQFVSDAVEEMLAANLIQRTSSPWNFGLVIVSKKPESPGATPKNRLCIDFRPINNIVLLETQYLPSIDDILGNLRGCTFFTTLDMRSGFHQIPLSEEASRKCAFSCHAGKFKFNVLPFGLSNAPGIFQDTMRRLLQGMETFSAAYMDDVLIYSSGNLEDHLHKVQPVIDRIVKHKLKLKIQKCQWALEKIEYLGFVVSKNGVSPQPDKVKAIRALKPPTTVKQTRSFLGMCSFYRRFIPNFAEISRPLIELTRKYARFHWSPECEKAFLQIKHQLTVVPLLAFPDTGKPYTLFTDASDSSIGACLCQEGEGEQWLPNVPNLKPIVFLSHKLSDTQRKSYSVTEKELFAIYYSVQKLRHYLEGAKFTILTDHRPLEHLFTAQHTNKRCMRWALAIRSHNCEIQYLKGEDNTVADLLSRSPPSDSIADDLSDPEEGFEVNAVINTNEFNPAEEAVADESINEQVRTPSPNNFDILEQQLEDPIIQDIKKKLLNNTAKKEIFRRHVVKDNVLYFVSQPEDNPRLRLYVPEQLKSKVLKHYHERLGHAGNNRMFKTISDKYYWKSLYADVCNHVQSCITCKTRNLTQQTAPVEETATPSGPMVHVQIDLSGPFRTSLSNNRYILSILDTYSGWLEAWPIPDKSADTVLQCFMDNFIPRFGCPFIVTSDNGGEFLNSKFSDAMKSLNIKHITTSVYNPRGNGGCERSHQTLNDIISKTQSHPETWDLAINQALMAMRASVSRTSNKSPHELLFHRPMALPLDNLLIPRCKTNSEDFHVITLQNMHQNFTEVLRQIRKAKKQRTKIANKNKKEVSFEVGDNVFVKNNRKESKLDKSWIPNNVVVEKTGSLSYKVLNLLSKKISRVHASRLRHWGLQWDVPKMDKPVRKTRLAAKPLSSDSQPESSDSEELSENETSEDSDDTIDYDPESYIQKQIKAKTLINDTQNESPSRFEVQRQLINVGNEQEQSSIEQEYTAMENDDQSEYQRSLESDPDPEGMDTIE